MPDTYNVRSGYSAWTAHVHRLQRASVTHQEHQKPPAASQQRVERWKLTAVAREQGLSSQGGKGEMGRETAATEPIETPAWPVRAARLDQAVYSKALKDGAAVIREEAERWKTGGT